MRQHNCCNILNKVDNMDLIPYIPYTSQQAVRGPPPKLSLPLEDLGLHLMHSFLDPPESISKWHFDQFSHFSRTHGCDQQTHTWYHATAVAKGRIYALCACDVEGDISPNISATVQYSYDTIRDAILMCAQKPTWVSLIYCTEMTTNKCKTEKVKNGYAQK